MLENVFSYIKKKNWVCGLCPYFLLCKYSSMKRIVTENMDFQKFFLGGSFDPPDPPLGTGLVPQCTKSKASTPLICYSLRFQKPIEMQHSSLAWTAVDFQGFISRLIQTPDRIWLPTLLEWTTRDLASPHLLCCNPAPNPSLDCLLGIKWLVLHERLGKL